MIRHHRDIMLALLITMPKRPHPLLLRLPQHPLDRVEPHVEVLHRRPEREPDEVVARRGEEVASVRGVDVEEDLRKCDECERGEEGRRGREGRGEGKGRTPGMTIVFSLRSSSKNVYSHTITH